MTWTSAFTTYTVLQALHSVMSLQFIHLVRITNIAFKRIGLKVPVIECVAFAFRVHCNISPLVTRMRCNSHIDWAVRFLPPRTRRTRMRCNIYGILQQFTACKCGIILCVIGAYKFTSFSKPSSFSPAISTKTFQSSSCPLYLLKIDRRWILSSRTENMYDKNVIIIKKLCHQHGSVSYL